MMRATRVSDTGMISLPHLEPLKVTGLTEVEATKAVAKQSGTKYVVKKLTSDPAYNLHLGAAYLKSLTNSFGGSYLLTAASYNAGPGRVRQWMRAFGDPRDGQTDPVDWVEKIPFSEDQFAALLALARKGIGKLVSLQKLAVA